MAFGISIHGVPKRDGEAVPVFDNVVWWDERALMKDIRFRPIDSPGYRDYVACLSFEEMLELQHRYGAQAWGRFKLESERLGNCLADQSGNVRWWVVTVFEWESGF